MTTPKPFQNHRRTNPIPLPMLLTALLFAGCKVESHPPNQRDVSNAFNMAGQGAEGEGPDARKPGVSEVISQGEMAPEARPGQMPRDGMTPQMGGTCAARSATAEQVVVEEEIVTEHEVVTIEPVSMYIMLDQSVSMMPLWAAAVQSIEQFVSDPMSDGVDVALGYFPVVGGVCMNGAVYDTPAVALGSLPGHAQAVIDNLALHMPSGRGTPTEGALRGATGFCQRYQADNPGKKCVAVVISDGEPTDTDRMNPCAIDQPTLEGVAAAGLSNGVLTYTVGLMGADFVMLDAIATAGGTDCDPTGPGAACDVTAGAEKLVDALTAIRDEIVTIETSVETVTNVVETPLECEWQIPEPEVGVPFDYDRVNVKLSSPVTQTPSLGKVMAADACADNGWHYDRNDQPTRIIACPQTCDTIKTTPQATVDILLDCETIVLK